MKFRKHKMNSTCKSLLLAASLMLWMAGCVDPAQADRKKLADGYSAYLAGRYDQSQQAATEYIQHQGESDNVDEAYYLRGLSYFSKGEKYEAMSDFQTAIARSNRDDLKAKSYRLLGDIAYGRVQFDEAIKNYEAAVPEYKNLKINPQVYFRLGAALQGVGKWDQARPWLQKVVDAKPDGSMLVHAQERLATTFFTLQFGAYENAAAANEQVKMLRVDHLVARVLPARREGQTLYLVQAGNYSTYAQADVVRETLIGKHSLVTIVP